MKIKHKQYLIVSIFVFFILLIYVYINKMFNPVGTSLFVFSFALLPISIILLFLKEQVFNAWKKFAMIFIAISAVWIIIAPDSCGGGWAGFGGCVFDKETTAMFTSAVFLITSLIIIAVKSWKLRK